MFPKPCRAKDKELLEKTRQEPCHACGQPAPSDPHHIKTRGSGGGDVPENILALCRRDHTLIHAIGITNFVKRYPHLKAKINR